MTIKFSKNVTLIILTSLFYGLSIGLNLVSLPLILQNYCYQKAQIAFILSFEILAVFFIAPFLMDIINKFGLKSCINLSIIVRNLFLATFGLINSEFALITSLFIFGIGGYILFTAFQIWINQISKNSNRGVNFGLLNAGLALGTALGPILLSIMHIKPSYESIIISSIVGFLILIPISMTDSINATTKQLPKICFNELINSATLPILCGFIVEYVFYALGYFIVLYGMSKGLAQHEAALLVSYMIIGNIILNIPIGYLIDKLNRKILVSAFSFIAMISFQLIPSVIMNKTYTILLFAILSSTISGIYIAGVSLIGDKYRDNILLAANAILSLSNAVGAFLGISVTGLAMHIWGDEGLIISLSFSFLLFFCYSLYKNFRQKIIF